MRKHDSHTADPIARRRHRASHLVAMRDEFAETSYTLSERAAATIAAMNRVSVSELCLETWELDTGPLRRETMLSLASLDEEWLRSTIGSDPEAVLKALPEFFVTAYRIETIDGRNTTSAELGSFVDGVLRVCSIARDRLATFKSQTGPSTASP